MNQNLTLRVGWISYLARFNLQSFVLALVAWMVQGEDLENKYPILFFNAFGPRIVSPTHQQT